MGRSPSEPKRLVYGAISRPVLFFMLQLMDSPDHTNRYHFNAVATSSQGVNFFERSSSDPQCYTRGQAFMGDQPPIKPRSLWGKFMMLGVTVEIDESATPNHRAKVAAY